MTAHAIVILAAGASTRLGRPKQLVRLGSESLLRRAARTALATAPSSVVVVLGANARLVASELDGLPVSVAVNHGWASGMGGSIRVGVEILKAKACEPNSIILMLCDQPFVTAEHLRALVRAANACDGIGASVYDGDFGVPAAFAREAAFELTTLDPARGAKALMRGPWPVRGIEFPEAAIDVDTEGDVERLASHLMRNA